MSSLNAIPTSSMRPWLPKPQVGSSILPGGASKSREILDLVQVCDARYSPLFSFVGGVSRGVSRSTSS